MDLFLPRNLELQKDGSVKAKDMTKHIVPLEGESFKDFYKRFIKETADLKDYERNCQIPLFQKKELYLVQIYSEPAYLTQKEQDEGLAPRLMFEKFFIDQDVANKWANNKIKQQSIGCYYSKNNPTKRQYKFSSFIENKKEKVYIHEEAINGKIIKREVEYGC